LDWITGRLIAKTLHGLIESITAAIIERTEVEYSEIASAFWGDWQTGGEDQSLPLGGFHAKRA
jgi:hypothetical protein